MHFNYRLFGTIFVVLSSVFVLFILKDIIFPFVAGVAVAYFFDPMADKLESKGIPRTLAALIILVLFFISFIGLLILIAPALQSQVGELLKMIPKFIGILQQVVTNLVDEFKYNVSPNVLDDARGAAGQLAGNIMKWASRLISNIWSGGIAFFNIISLLLITPIVAFYLLRDWDIIIEKLDLWLPRSSAPVIREQLKLIDQTVAGFVRGQASVCLVLAIFYSLGLTLVGLKSGLLVGVMAGLISFVPYFGAGFGLLVGVGIAYFQFFDHTPILIIFFIFILGQICESYILTPRLVGDRVGLHPTWIIFALLAGGALFGFVGVLLAVPVTAVIGVLARFFIAQYLESSIYSDKNQN